jgi:hypothetical protein
METCGICAESIDENNMQILKCCHKFHYDCIVKEFISQLDNYQIRKKLICPYCREQNGKLPMKPGFIPVKNVTENYNYFFTLLKQEMYDDLKPFFDEKRCHSILKTGINKGSQCSRKHKNGSLFCNSHKKFI